MLPPLAPLPPSSRPGPRWGGASPSLPGPTFRRLPSMCVFRCATTVWGTMARRGQGRTLPRGGFLQSPLLWDPPRSLPVMPASSPSLGGNPPVRRADFQTVAQHVCVHIAPHAHGGACTFQSMAKSPMLNHPFKRVVPRTPSVGACSAHVSSSGKGCMPLSPALGFHAVAGLDAPP